MRASLARCMAADGERAIGVGATLEFYRSWEMGEKLDVKMTCAHVCMCMYVCMCVCMFVCVFVCM